MPFRLCGAVFVIISSGDLSRWPWTIPLFVDDLFNIQNISKHPFIMVSPVLSLFIIVFSIFSRYSSWFLLYFLAIFLINVWGHRNTCHLSPPALPVSPGTRWEPLGLMLFPSIDLHLPNRASIFDGHLPWENGDLIGKQWKTMWKWCSEWLIISDSWWFLWWLVVFNNGYIIVANSD